VSLLGKTSTLISAGGYLHLFYSDYQYGDIRHSWWNGSGGWGYQVLDGDSAVHTWHVVDGPIVAVYHSGILHVFYNDTNDGDVVHAWSGSSPGVWSYLVHLGGVDPVSLSGGGCSHYSYYTGSKIWLDYTSGGKLMTSLYTSSWSSSVSDGHQNSNQGQVNLGVGTQSAMTCELYAPATFYTLDATGDLRVRVAADCL
jgi:hypothetical protein